MIAEIWRENDGGELSYWAATEDGYCFLDMEPGGGCHTAHEGTQADMKRVFKSLAPCDCPECLESKSNGGRRERIARIASIVKLDNVEKELILHVFEMYLQTFNPENSEDKEALNEINPIIKGIKNKLQN